MSKTTDELRAVGVFNDHGFFDGDEPRGQVWLSYHAKGGHRDVLPSRWFVYRKGHKTAPDGAWYDHGCKTFSGFNRREGMTHRASALEDAKAWAGERYGITEWKRTPFGGWGDAEYVTARLRELRSRARAA